MFYISAETKKYPTEDSHKIAKALQTIVPAKVHKKKLGEQIYLKVESQDYSALDNLYHLFRKHRILDVARGQLLNGRFNSGTAFFINKQAAYANKINFCQQKGESPLGPIRIVIEYENIDHLIDWLTPYTKEGKEVTLVETFP
ncbi:MAG: RNA-binding domain-containing protein [Asgard group archaeon]|nr:RNA-binding domain-containing protein [Asgard group archaeon]